MSHNKLVMLVIIIFTIGLEVRAQVRGGELPGPLPLFPPDHWWNVDITSAPVDANSSAFHPDFGGDSGDPASPIYGIPYIVVSGSQPLVPVVFDYDDGSDAGAPGRPPGYPIPEQAKSEQKWIEGAWRATTLERTATATCSSSIATTGFSTSSTRCDRFAARSASRFAAATATFSRDHIEPDRAAALCRWAHECVPTTERTCTSAERTTRAGTTTSSIPPSPC